MTTRTHQQIIDRLLTDDRLASAAVNLVDAACAGEEALAAALATLDASAAPPARTELQRASGAQPGVYLSQIRVGGFRGVGPERALALAPGPGLTLVLGRNGSGKSSFAEGLETLLTGSSQRWINRAKDWRDGWKNLHVNGNAFVEATFTIEGSEPLIVRRVWTPDALLEQSELRSRRGAEKLDSLDALGWSDALVAFRPFLSYGELSALLNKPSELYDSLKGILGLEEIVAATKRLAAERKSRDDRSKDAKSECKRLLQTLAEMPDDPRARACVAAIKGRSWKLDDVASAVFGEHDSHHEDLARLLRSLCQLSVPDLTVVTDTVAELRRCMGALAELAGTSAEQNARLADVLGAALRYCGDTATACPVCGGAIDPDWPPLARDRLAEAKDLADRVRQAANLCDLQQGKLRGLVSPPPAALARAAEAGLPEDLLDAWSVWAEAPSNPTDLCAHIEAHVLELHAAFERFRADAQAKLAALESAWRPVALELAKWLDLARVVAKEAETLKALGEAEEWLKDAESALRDERFAPIASHAQAIWSMLRQQSNVDLAKVKLDGKGTKRHVDLEVSVDGHDGVALGVMSQGELNALALSLFLPRMMLAESPFRFLIIDDPVQAMDPHKVDGLARVLRQAASTRQVIVFTHDTRLHEALRRLQINANVLEVQRRARSVVEIAELLDPVERHLKDALAVANNEREIGSKIASRTVPAFCRLAIESACVEAVRRRRLSAGASHPDVEQLLEQARGVHQLAALAIHDDIARDGEVYSYLKNKLGSWAADAFREVKEGTHHGLAGTAYELVDSSRKIAKVLRSIS
jgi:recombinational DNA repair ATPase RecF